MGASKREDLSGPFLCVLSWNSEEILCTRIIAKQAAGPCSALGAA